MAPAQGSHHCKYGTIVYRLKLYLLHLTLFSVISAHYIYFISHNHIVHLALCIILFYILYFSKYDGTLYNAIRGVSRLPLRINKVLIFWSMI